MNRIENALMSLAKMLASERSLADTIDDIEGDFARALGARAIEIAFAEHALGPSDATICTFPMMLDGRSFGRIAFRFDTAPGETQRALAEAFVAPIALALAWRSQRGESDRLSGLVYTDALTGLPNRLAFNERLNAAWRRSSERRTPLTLALIDIDYFKVFNDLHGHPAGDDCLRAVGERLAESARRVGGFVARYGGEEFGFIAESYVGMQAVEAVGRVFEIFERSPIVHTGTTLGRVSLSAGVTSIVASDATTIAHILGEADRSLYRAKALGRNRVCLGDYTSVGAIVSRRAPERSNASASSFVTETIGRNADLSRIVAALRHARLVSLVGPAGIGKSRLARVAAEHASAFVLGGVSVIDFSSIAEHSDPYATIGAALDIAVESSDTRTSVLTALRPGSLMVLDNIPAPVVPRVAMLCDELLSSTSDLTILVTSRTAIGGREERAMLIAGLDHEASVELLRARSGLADVARLRSLVQALGGVPGAIEATARRLTAEDERASTRAFVQFV